MPVVDYQTDLVKRLANPDYAACYLKAAFDEAVEDGDIEAFFLALENISEAVETSGLNSEPKPKSLISDNTLFADTTISSESIKTLTHLNTILSRVGLTIDFKSMGA